MKDIQHRLRKLESTTKQLDIGCEGVEDPRGRTAEK